MHQKEKNHYCYLTGDKITPENSSLEHIIPNALGGFIKSRNILSNQANKKLSQDVDNKFNEIFAGTHRRLPIEKDRQTNRGVIGFHPRYNKKVVLKDGKWFPWEPFYDTEKKIVYAQTHKIAQKFIDGMVKRGELDKDEKISTMDDLSGVVEIPFELGNLDFAKGLAKIAAGFATLHGIKRKDLDEIIDLERKEIRDDIKAFPFRPQNPWEMAFELNAHKSEHFPIHGLSLFSVPEQNALLCYIELFSTYQFIVVLNRNYRKKIHKSYIYSLSNSKEIFARDYYKAVLGEDQYRIFNLKSFRHLSDNEINQMLEDIDIPEIIKPYTMHKFHGLSEHTSDLEIKNKVARLDKDLDDERKNQS